MGKRSNFKRIPRDLYTTWDERAYPPILSQIAAGATFPEPCAGGGEMVDRLEGGGLRCVEASDIEPGRDGILRRDVLAGRWEPDLRAENIITNPPWRTELLHPMIELFRERRPTWLLFYFDWAATKQAAPYIKYCHRIVPTPRLKWIPNSAHGSTDNTAWYLFKDSVGPASVVHPEVPA